jgi:hypothetical protein
LHLQTKENPSLSLVCPGDLISSDRAAAPNKKSRNQDASKLLVFLEKRTSSQMHAFKKHAAPTTTKNESYQQLIRYHSGSLAMKDETH